MDAHRAQIFSERRIRIGLRFVEVEAHRLHLRLESSHRFLDAAELLLIHLGRGWTPPRTNSARDHDAGTRGQASCEQPRRRACVPG